MRGLAYASDGRPTNVEVAAVDEAVPGPAGTSYVAATDLRLGYKIAGWYFGLGGVGTLALAAANYDEDGGLENLAAAGLGVGIYLLIVGTFLALGYGTDGPEESQPSAGFRADAREGC